MDKLKILIPTKITSNPFIFQLIRALQNHDEVLVVQHGLDWLNDNTYKFDIILFQWPEILNNWNEPKKEDLQWIERIIMRWKKQGAKLIATIHNLNPHKNKNKYSVNLYDLVYSNCDAIIHFGESSKKLFSQQPYYSYVHIKEYIIPHGNYDYLENSVSKTNARKYLNIEKDKFVLLSFGAIRKKNELDLLLEVSKSINKYNGNLLIVGRLPYQSKKQFRFYLSRLPFWIRKNIILKEGYINNKDVQIYLNACDVMIIPRTDTLNSGNVALGYTYGKPVIGPNYGVIGEELIKNGNPVFNVNYLKSSVRNAIDHCFNERDGIGKNNKIYSEKEMNWNKIANKYIKVFKKTISKGSL